MSTKISVNLSDEVHDAARELAVKHDVTLSEVLRRAISTEVFLDREFERGKTLLLRDERTKEIERVHFRGHGSRHMTTNSNHPPDENPHSEPDRFLNGDRAASPETLTDRDNLVSISTGAADHPQARTSTKAPGVEDEPGLIEYRKERIPLEELQHRDDAKLKSWAVRWILILVSALALIAVFTSDSPSTTALGLVSSLLAFVGGTMYGRRYPPAN